MCEETEKNINIKIDGELVQVEPGLTILEACRQFGFDVPTLCFDEALVPYAACRLCVVEVVGGRAKRTVASCAYPVEEGQEISTSTDEIARHRRNLIELYLSRSPDAKAIQKLAEKHGVKIPRYEFKETDNCILCGRCVRACGEVVKASAIGFVERGMKRRVEPPFLRGSAACISCGTCTTICPTEAIRLDEIDRVQSAHVFPHGAHESTCKICSIFELVPKTPGDYAGWLSDKATTPARRKPGKEK